MKYGETFNNFGNFWGDDELLLLQTQYPVGGVRLISKLLPHRSKVSIRTKASKLGIKRPECDRGNGFNQAVFDKMTEADAAYFAGFIDGEGCIFISKAHNLVLTATNTHKGVIDKFLNVIGGSVKIRPQRQRQREVFRWQVNGQRALMFLEKIFPYLVVKKQEAELAMNFQKCFVYTNRKITPEIWQEREAVRIQLSDLKGRIK